MIKPSHYKTPRQMRDCWEDTRLSTDQPKEPWYVLLTGALVVVAMVMIAAWRG